MTGDSFSCNQVLDFAGADVSRCYWIDESEINAEVSDAFDLIPGSNVTLVPGVVARRCNPATGRCDCNRAANASTVFASSPNPPLVPKALLDGPTTAAACEGLAVGSSQSTGSGGRAMTYAWNATAILRDDWVDSANTTNATATMRVTLLRMLEIANAGTGSASFVASSEDLVAMAAGGIQSLELSLILANFLEGTSAPSAPFRVEIRTDTPPNLEIVGGIVQSATRPDALSVRAEAIATSCDGRPLSER